MHRRNGVNYRITSEETEQYNELGYLVLNDVLTELEMQTFRPLV